MTSSEPPREEEQERELEIVFVFCSVDILHLAECLCDSHVDSFSTAELSDARVSSRRGKSREQVKRNEGFDLFSLCCQGDGYVLGVYVHQGLAFSVPRGVSLPPSLQNIFKEVGKLYLFPLSLSR